MSKESWIESYGLEKVVSEQDDPALWEAAIRKHWLPPDDPSILVDALRFGTGRRLVEGEKAQGESDDVTASQRALVGVEDWHFNRDGDGLYAVESYGGVGPVPPVILPGMSLMAGMPGFTAPSLPELHGSVVRQYLTISRPSVGVDEAVVYSGTTAPGLGDGASYIWKKINDGHWEQTEHCISRWLT
jgi:hypothetical protein